MSMLRSLSGVSRAAGGRLLPRSSSSIGQTRSASSTDDMKNKQPTMKGSNGFTSQYAVVDHTFDAVVVGAGMFLQLTKKSFFFFSFLNRQK